MGQFDVKRDLAVQSWCFRAFKPLDQLVQQIKGIGLGRVELCGVHADFNNEGSFAGVLAQLEKGGVKVGSIGVQTFSGNEAAERKWFQFAKQAGAKMISASFDLYKTPQAYRVAEKLADEFDINLGIHNHGGYDWLGSTNMLNYVLQNSSKRIGVCLDTAWMLAAGEDPIKAADKFADRLYGVHIKDFVFERTGKPEDVVVGTGNLDLKALMKIITTKAHHCHSVTLEYEGDENNPGPKLKECVDKVQQAA